MLFFRKRLHKSTKEEEIAFASRMEKAEVGFKDVLAMTISAFYMLVLPCLLILVGLSLLLLLIFGLL